MTAMSDLPVAVLAGGLATRLHPITESVPKLLVEVAGEPFFSHQLRLLKAAGLKRVIVCAGYLGEMIVEQYGNGAKFGMQVEYSFDGPKLLGTGGALIRALPLLGNAFYVIYGDSYLPIAYRMVGEFFLQSGKLGLMTVFRNEGRFDRSNVRFEDGEIKAYEKRCPTPQMHHIDYGLGLFRPAAFDGFRRESTVDLADVQQALLAKNELAGFEISDRFYEIGSPAGLEELSRLLTERRR